MKRLAAVLLASLSLLACGAESETTERALTADEAALLAEIQFRNFEIGGADFIVNAAFTELGDSITMSGSIDWVNHLGQATVAASGQEAGIDEVMWSSNEVLESRPAMTQMLAAIDLPSVRFIARPPDSERRLLDRTIGILVSLASTERDNALLIQQKEGSLFLRSDVLRGQKVFVLRYGKSLRYWVDQSTSELLRFEGDSNSGTAPIVIDFMAFGQRTIAQPPQDSVVAVSEISELYDAARNS
jgi:hypothetical protein